ncbi:MAG: GNAT family N-acetyltransferase, partial [Bradymonadaceae bacterium]
EEYDVAAIGNLVTHPKARGQGYATACTGRLLDELFEEVSLVALNVRNDNSPAISVYTSFGFQQNSTFWEGRAVTDKAENGKVES